MKMKMKKKYTDQLHIPHPTSHHHHIITIFLPTQPATFSYTRQTSQRTEDRN
jgi:hypothetical protein